MCSSTYKLLYSFEIRNGNILVCILLFVSSIEVVNIFHSILSLFYQCFRIREITAAPWVNLKYLKLLLFFERNAMKIYICIVYIYVILEYICVALSRGFHWVTIHNIILSEFRYSHYDRSLFIYIARIRSPHANPPILFLAHFLYVENDCPCEIDRPLDRSNYVNLYIEIAQQLTINKIDIPQIQNFYICWPSYPVNPLIIFAFLIC